MTPEAWITVAVIVVVIILLMSNRVSVDVTMVGGLTLLMLLGVVDPKEAISGFAERAVIMIGAIYVVAAGLTETGAIEVIAARLLGRPKTVAAAQMRMMPFVAMMSAFMNTTAIVAMSLPIVSDLCKRMRLSPSRLYIPLSYAAILGGTCTLIGTSSNITINSLYLNFIDANPDLGLERPGFWWITRLGLPSAIVGIAFVVIASRWLLPDRTPVRDTEADARRFTVEMEVQAGSPIVGKTIEEAGLRHLPGLFLSQIERGDELIPAVAPTERLEAGDRLTFAGVLESVVDLRKIRGLVPATDQVSKIQVMRRNRAMVEAVVSPGSPLVGRTVRESRFRTVYNAAIIAVHRHGHSIDRKIGDIVLKPGDTLLLETHRDFVSAYRNTEDFYLVSQLEGVREIRHERAGLALGILGLMIALLVFEPFGIDQVAAVLLCSGLMIGSRCVTGTVARNSIHLEVLLTIGAAIGIGRAMQATGAAEDIAGFIIRVTEGMEPRWILMALFLTTSVFAQLVTNNGAAVLMFPIYMNVAGSLGVHHEPFVVSLMVASACSFMTPMAYQTNLMVYGPGGYKFMDYPRMGIPLTLLIAGINAVLAPIFFPFHG